MKNYKDLNAWQKSINLVKEVYGTVALYPKEELYALTQQTKRATVSIPAKIAEGIKRNSRKDGVYIFSYIKRIFV